ncbi:MAG: hypothetical protein IPL61_14530 [Myxococcales bacterium]|nr:hypothetical protein [Myxococcales bacterium]
MVKFGARMFLLVAATLVCGSTGLFLTLFVPARQEAAADSALHLRARSMALLLADAIGDAVATNNAAAGQRRVDSLATDRDFGYAVAVRADGATFVEARRPALDPGLVRLEVVRAVTVDERGGLVHARAPIVDASGVVVGTVLLGLSRSWVVENKADTRLWVGACSLAVLVLAIVSILGATKPLKTAAGQLLDLSDDLVALAREQEASSAEESAAVEETRRSMSTLLSSAEEIAGRSSEVLGNSERSVAQSREIASKIDRLSGLLHSIEQIADRTDLLALNAALEGTRAGEAGRGFALVADEMRRLAESVLETAAAIRELMKEMHRASEEAVGASQLGATSSEKIALLTQQQRQATEAVVASMDEMRAVLVQTLSGIQRSTQAAESLSTLSRTLTGLVDARGGARPTAKG